MQLNKRNTILKNAGLLGVSTVLGFSAVASAAPNNDVKRERRDVKEARKDVKDARKDTRQADTARERREAQQDLRDAQRDVQRQKQDVRQEKREDNRPGYPNNANPNWNRPAYTPGYRPGTTPNNGNWNRPVNRPGYGSNGGNWSQQNTTVEGTVISNGAGRNFTLRATNGQVWQVQVQGSAPVGLSRGDVVRVFGPTRGTSVLASGLRVLQNR